MQASTENKDTPFEQNKTQQPQNVDPNEIKKFEDS